MRRAMILGFGCAAMLAGGSALAAPVDLQDALVEAYDSNPTLQAERANLRATDEGVPQALSGWRPTVTLSGSYGKDNGNETISQPFVFSSATNRSPLTGTATLTQPIFSGGATRAAVHKAKNSVFAERAKLIATEEQVFGQAISDYVTVIEDRQLLSLNQNNEQVLGEQLKATQDRFRVGELTQTDVAQAQAALEGAKAQVATAIGNLAAAKAAYEHDIGSAPPDDLIPPAQLALHVNNVDEVSAYASKNNATVVSAQFTLAAAHDNVDATFAALLPQVSGVLTANRTQNQSYGIPLTNDTSAVIQLQVPLYQGGAEYSKVRQAKEQVQQAEQSLIDARMAAVASAVQAYETLIANEAAADSDRAQIKANAIALSGVEREALIGTRTTLDVLNAEQALLQSRTSLVQNLAQAVASSYGVASAMGQLTARDLSLNVTLYDETAYYDSVDTKLWGVSVPNSAGGKR